MSDCYLCGRSPASKPLELKDSFTAHGVAACPESEYLCDRCEFALNTRAMFWNEKKAQYSLLFARTWSWLYQGDVLLSPRFEGEHEGFPVVKDLALRSEIREWLVNPPEPPFTIAIAESGKKHILFLAKEGMSRDLYPVQFETDRIWINRPQLITHLGAFEGLMAIGANKTEIVSGEYHGQTLMSVILDDRFNPWEEIIASLRGTRYLDLLSHVAVKQEDLKPEQKIVIKAEPEAIKSPAMQQLSLF